MQKRLNGFTGDSGKMRYKQCKCLKRKFNAVLVNTESTAYAASNISSSPTLGSKCSDCGDKERMTQSNKLS